MYQNFIFDLYGTLVDIHTNENSAYFWTKCAALLTECGYPYTAAELKKRYNALIGMEKEKLTPHYAQPEIDLGIVFTKLMKEKGVKPAKEFISFYASVFRVLSRKYVKLYPEIIDIMNLLKENDKKIYLLSNAQTLFTIPEMKELGIYDYFDDILISSDCHCKKPDPAFMQILLEKHGLNISESIMIGNEYGSDIAVADAVGMDSYYIHSNLSPALTGAEKATYMDLESGSLQTKEIMKVIFDKKDL